MAKFFSVQDKIKADGEWSIVNDKNLRRFYF
jgi:hypothetical protein